MSNSYPRPEIASGLIWRTIDDDAVVVSPQVGSVRVFNGVGTMIWRMLAEGKEIAQIVACLVESYGIAMEQAEEDLQAFLKELQARELIVWRR